MSERTDTERLNWLDHPWVKVYKFPNFAWMSEKTDVHPDYTQKHILSSLTLRQAIDAAMDAEGDS